MSEASRGDQKDRIKEKGKATVAGEANILPAEAFTHGGVKKTKFEPKVPTRRLKKLAQVKREPGESEGGELSSELQRLIQQSQEDASGFRRRPDNKAPVRVAFGFGSATAGRAAAGSAGFGKTRYGSGGGGGGGGGGGESRKASITIATMEEFKSGKKKNATDPMDYDQYYPVCLPLRKPNSGLAEVLDEEEFGGSQDYDEDEVPAAKELGLFEESLEDKFMFFQLPSALPVDMLPEAAKDEGSSNPPPKAVGSKKTGTISLDKLPEGFLGKLLVYESGAVKLQLGEVIFDAMPGTNCVFAQELAAINPVAKHCLFLGDIRQRVVLTPDIDRLLDKNSETS